MEEPAAVRDLTAPRVFARDTVEFDRALNFIDAIFGFSITLLITNLQVPTGNEWRSVSALLGGPVGNQLTGFAISFVVIAGFWRLNHRVIAGFRALDAVTVQVGIMLAGFVIFIPFTTQGISGGNTGDLPLPTAVYALNVAVVVLVTVLLVLLGRRRGLTADTGSALQATARELSVAAVFLASIVVAYRVGPGAAKLSWLSLMVIPPVVDWLAKARSRGRSPGR
jgi:uncharacterized membrane protein